MESQQTKICSKCKAEKSIDDFYKNKSKKDGKACSCKDCSKMDSRKYLASIGKYTGVSKIWTEEEKDYLRANYASAKVEDMLKFLPNTTWETIKQKAVHLKISGVRRAYIIAQNKLKPKKKRIYKYIPKKVPSVKTVNPKKEVKVYHKELPRFVEKKFETRKVDHGALLPFRLDKKTTLYLPVNMSDEKKTEVIARYQMRKTA